MSLNTSNINDILRYINNVNIEGITNVNELTQLEKAIDFLKNGSQAAKNIANKVETRLSNNHVYQNYLKAEIIEKQNKEVKQEEKEEKRTIQKHQSGGQKIERDKKEKSKEEIEKEFFLRNMSLQQQIIQINYWMDNYANLSGKEQIAILKNINEAAEEYLKKGKNDEVWKIYSAQDNTNLNDNPKNVGQNTFLNNMNRTYNTKKPEVNQMLEQLKIEAENKAGACGASN